MKEKSSIFLGVSVLLLAISTFLYVQGPPRKQLQEQYSEGYSAGVKAEQAKWSDSYLQLAKQSISDQIESQPSIERLVNGDFEEMKISRVEKKGDNQVFIWLEARWKDKTYTTGYFELKKVNDQWFLVTTRQTETGDIPPAKQVSGE